MESDNYSDLADKYDCMISKDPNRMAFFEKVLLKHRASSILDCSCGTGQDLIMFSSIVQNITGSDLSESMLAVAKSKLNKAGFSIKLKKADFRYLNEAGFQKFDSVVCLSSSICEIHSDKDVIIALRSMFEILNDGGVLIIDQGQSDAMMKSRPRFIPVINNLEISRLFVIDYEQNSNLFITVNICDLEHTEKNCAFNLNSFKLRVRTINEWKELLKESGIFSYQIYGDWEMNDYNENDSPRIIITVVKANLK